MDEKEHRLAEILLTTPLRHNTENMEEFAKHIVSAMRSLQKNVFDSQSVRNILDSVLYCLRIGTVGGRPIFDTVLGNLYTGPFLASGSYNRLTTAVLEGQKVLLRTILRPPETGTKSVRIFAIEVAIHAILDGERGIPKLYLPIKIIRGDGGLDLGCVIEHVTGETMLDVLQERHMNDVRAFTILINVMETLCHLWDQYGFRHRDLRADNIMVENEQDDIKLIDFGFSIIEKYGLDCNPEPTFVRSEEVPRAIDTMLLLWTTVDDCYNLIHTSKVFHNFCVTLLEPHRKKVFEQLTDYHKMTKDEQWYYYQRHCIYCAKDIPSMWPVNVLAEARRALTSLKNKNALE
jgi:serine/threonine protein kinase